MNLNKQNLLILVTCGVILSGNQLYIDFDQMMFRSLSTPKDIVYVYMCLNIYVGICHLQQCHNQCLDLSRSSPLASFRWITLQPVLSNRLKADL